VISFAVFFLNGRAGKLGKLFSFLQLRETYLGTKHSPKTGRGKIHYKAVSWKRFFVEIYRVPVPFVMLILEKKMLRTENRGTFEYIVLREMACTYCFGYSGLTWLISEMTVGCIHFLIYQLLEM
jgi:hypothetical protein